MKNNDNSIARLFRLCFELERTLRSRLNLAMTARHGGDWYLNTRLYFAADQQAHGFVRSNSNGVVLFELSEDGSSSRIRSREGGAATFLSGLYFPVLAKIAISISYAMEVESLFLDPVGDPLQEMTVKKWFKAASETRDKTAHNRFGTAIDPAHAASRIDDLERVIASLRQESRSIIEVRASVPECKAA